eukprot:scaffold466596_cov30-Prasinocladus_malaysianus.AAC.1
MRNITPLLGNESPAGRASKVQTVYKPGASNGKKRISICHCKISSSAVATNLRSPCDVLELNPARYDPLRKFARKDK